MFYEHMASGSSIFKVKKGLEKIYSSHIMLNDY